MSRKLSASFAETALLGSDDHGAQLLVVLLLGEAGEKAVAQKNCQTDVISSSLVVMVVEKLLPLLEGK